MEKFIVDYKMVNQYVVEVGSLWDYNRQFDNSPVTSRLKVKSVKDGRVEFEQRMPFTSYSLDCFDGYIFKPHVPRK